MARRNLLYAQSGGVTPVINATAAAVIEAARRRTDAFGQVLAARDGIVGVLTERLIDTASLQDDELAALSHTPGGVFGSCRYKLRDVAEDRREYERIIEVFRAHDIGCFLYNGGNDSADTAWKLSQVAERLEYPLQCIGVPKTIDNDLAVTDSSPGFGSVAKYVAVSILEASLDVLSMASTSTRVFVLEVMGRHAGWIAAAAGLAQREQGDPPQVILLPERGFDQARFLDAVQQSVERNGYCSVVVSEGLRDQQGQFLADAGGKDAFGHRQLGGVGPMIAELITDQLGFKNHWAVADYLQRSARHIASQTDLEHARAVGEAAVELAVEGQNGVMPVIRRISDHPYRWTTEAASLERIANQEKTLPDHFISEDGFGITPACREYLAPLIRGEAFPPFAADGLPRYVRPRLAELPRRLDRFPL
ncbi:6-phosphofructokinase [Wenzhouxiangella sp. AB-CW3]|uniref:6-phosphofructokinase n=1 Tax=Wenzhouxiangella sp. AB-CW3 TaxID=2771012 RepID=UPI00168A99EB|nr:6-phosphofructokinase [Wenzhouxiangella sp. AB-CW3]QOC22827.1 6-phosphofructokinase [Wenzhouxiangella sp. AB-CW3]